MRVCLVGDHGDPSDATINLGHLCLVPVIEACGGSAALVEVSALPASVRTRTPAIADHVLEHDPDVIGFTGMCNTYHRLLDVATHCKRRRPRAVIVFGGPQASATDVATIDAFPAVDVVVRGEGELTLAELLGALGEGRGPSGIPGLTCRGSDGQAVRGPERDSIPDLDTLPFPAYDRQAYDAGVGNVEAGRGCPYACVYCSTSVHWRRLHRMKSPARIVGEMSLLASRHGVRTFSLVHDLFTVNRRAVEAFCDALQAARLNVTWGCSSRTDLVDDALLDRMAASGCRSIYFGIEAGSDASQRTIGKRLDLDEARRTVSAASRRGIRSTASFIAGLPDETVPDVRATFSVAASLMTLERVHLEFHRPLLLSGTPLLAAHAGDLEYPTAEPGARPAGGDDDGWQHVARHPELFPSLARLRSTVHGLHDALAHVDLFGHVALNLFRLSSAVAIAESGGDALGYCLRWQAAMARADALRDPFRDERKAAASVGAMIALTARFLVQDEAAGAGAPFHDLVRYETVRSRVEWAPGARPLLPHDVARDAMLAGVPRPHPTAVVATFSHDMARLLRLAREGRPIAGCPRRRCDVVFWMPDVTGTSSRTLTAEGRLLFEACREGLTGQRVVEKLGADTTGRVTNRAWADLLEIFVRSGILVVSGTAA